MRAVLAVAVIAGLLLTVLGGCRSLPKSELEARLLALGKNAAITGLERLSFTADLGHGPEPLELVYHRAPAKRSQGPVDPVPVVLIHGTPSTLFTWTEILHGGEGFAGLAAQRDGYALEVLGHGLAPGGDPVDFERCARFVAAAIRALGLERVHLVGQSYGGEFAWRAALNEPALVASLVVMDSSGLARRPDDWLPEEVEMRANSLADYGWWINSRDRVATALAPHFRALPPERVEEFFLVCENATNWRAMIDLVQDENGARQDELGLLEPPTLVLWGAEDLAYAPDHYGRGFADVIPGAQWRTVPAAGHYPHEERPSEVITLLEEFFDAHPAGGPR